MDRRPRLPLGLSDFLSLRRGGFLYVDKTPLIDAVLEAGAQVLLLPRPRRFGKTLNLSMLRHFFERSDEDKRPLFADLAVASSQQAWSHFQRYPTLFVSFKDVKAGTWPECFAGISKVLADLYEQHRYLLSSALSPQIAEIFSAILEGRATEADCSDALRLLSRLLAQHHGEGVVMLIDEYDTPIHAGYVSGYYDQVISFFRTLLSGGLKDNPHLFKGVLTGILRVARESIFSGLNNVVVYSILRPELATSFGFTEPEVRRLCEDLGQGHLLDDIRAFYNGYIFGRESIYNPWSVLNFLDSADKELRPYWVATSSNELIRDLLLGGPHGVRTELEALLAGGAIEKPIEENIVLRDVSARTEAVWSFLLFSGYLKAMDVEYRSGVAWGRLAVPNQEVAVELHSMVRAWMETQAGGADEVQRLIEALLRGDARRVERMLSRIVKVSLSYFDTGGPEPERVYHGFVMGLLASLGPGYEVRSNRESGFGRCDVLILPRKAGRAGVALELKTVDVEEGESVEAALAAALGQIREREYATELRERGAAPIHEVAAVFDGKRAYVRVVQAAPPG